MIFKCTNCGDGSESCILGVGEEEDRPELCPFDGPEGVEWVEVKHPNYKPLTRKDETMNEVKTEQMQNVTIKFQAERIKKLVAEIDNLKHDISDHVCVAKRVGKKMAAFLCDDISKMDVLQGLKDAGSRIPNCGLSTILNDAFNEITEHSDTIARHKGELYNFMCDDAIKFDVVMSIEGAIDRIPDCGLKTILRDASHEIVLSREADSLCCKSHNAPKTKCEQRQCPECQYSFDTGMNFCTSCGRQIWDQV